MITQFKIFEKVKKGTPKLGDYVIFDNYKEFIIAEVIMLPTTKRDSYIVKWNHKTGGLYIYEIIDWSDNKEELELKLQTIKYNL